MTDSYPKNIECLTRGYQCHRQSGRTTTRYTGDRSLDRYRDRECYGLIFIPPVRRAGAFVPVSVCRVVGNSSRARAQGCPHKSTRKELTCLSNYFLARQRACSSPFLFLALVFDASSLTCVLLPLSLFKPR